LNWSPCAWQHMIAGETRAFCMLRFRVMLYAPKDVHALCSCLPLVIRSCWPVSIVYQLFIEFLYSPGLYSVL
jgi:hypothetical protein